MSYTITIYWLSLNLAEPYVFKNDNHNLQRKQSHTAQFILKLKWQHIFQTLFYAIVLAYLQAFLYSVSSSTMKGTHTQSIYTILKYILLFFFQDNLFASSLFAKSNSQQAFPRHTQQKLAIYDEPHLHSYDKVLLKSVHFLKPGLWSVSEVCDSVSTQINYPQTTIFSCGGAILLFAWRNTFQSYKLCLSLENSVYQSWMTFQMWNKINLENGQISRWTVRRWQECVWHRSTTTTLQRRKSLWTPPRSYCIHQVSPMKCKTDQLLSICLQSLLLIEPLLAENHFSIILSPESFACSSAPFAKEKRLSHSKWWRQNLFLF